MTGALRLLAFTVVVMLVVSGPLAPWALAQSPTAAPAADPLAREREQARAEAEEQAAAYEAGAAVVNAFHVPGKAILCGLGGVLGLGTLLLTFGTGYKAAAAVAREGCGGRWVVTGDDLRPDRSRADWD